MLNIRLILCLICLALVLGCGAKQYGDYDKNVIVLGGAQYQRVHEAAAAAAKEKLAQYGYTVLDEGGMAGARRGLSKSGYYMIAREAHADWMLLIHSEAIARRQNPDHAFNQITVTLSLELIEVSSHRVLATSHDRHVQNLGASRPSRGAWLAAAEEAARQGAEVQVSEVLNSRR